MERISAIPPCVQRQLKRWVRDASHRKSQAVARRATMLSRAGIPLRMMESSTRSSNGVGAHAVRITWWRALGGHTGSHATTRGVTGCEDPAC
jgi:hypothetical protein